MTNGQEDRLTLADNQMEPSRPTVPCDHVAAASRLIWKRYAR